MASALETEAKIKKASVLRPEAVMLKAFSEELNKLAFSPDYAINTFTSAGLGALGSEAMNRVLYGDNRMRQPGDMARDAMSHGLMHLGVTGATELARPTLVNYAKSQAKGTLGRQAARFGLGGLKFMKNLTSPIGTVGLSMAMPLIGYGIDKITGHEQPKIEESPLQGPPKLRLNSY